MRKTIATCALAVALCGCQTTAESADPRTGSSVSRTCLPASIKQTLAEVERRFGKVTIVSTFRRGAKIAGSRKPSYHASCRAVDFHPPPGKYRQVLAYLDENHEGGLGTYSGGFHHLHLDNGPYVRFHKRQWPFTGRKRKR